MDEDRSIEPEHWVDRHGDALYGFAMLRLRDADASAEVVQETFVAALRTADRFSGLSSERTWLIGILKHKILDHFRRKARLEAASGDPEATGQDLDSFFGAAGNWKAGPSRWGDDASLAAERGEFWEIFRICLAELPPIYADAFTLHELDDLSGEEICEILGITATNLASRLHRARLLLRKSLEIRWFNPPGPVR